MAIRQTRHSNLSLIAKRYKRQKDFALAIGLSPSFTSQIVQDLKPIGNELARKIEIKLGLEDGALDVSAQGAKAEGPGAEVMSAAYAIESFPAGVRLAFVRLIMAVSAAGINRPEDLPAPDARPMATPFEMTNETAAATSKPASGVSEGRRRSR